MTKFKKFTSVAVAAVMMTGLTFPAFGEVASDVANTPYAEAAQKLKSLNIMVGDDTGTFRPEDQIKRSEFAKIAVAAMGLESAAQSAQNITKFSDVAADHWAKGYINIAASQGLFVGDPEGTFRPDDSVSYAEAITVLTRMLGYGQVINNQNWPVPFLAKAAELDLTKDVSFKASDKAIRGNIAKLTANTLDIPLLIQVGYGSDSKYVVSGTENTTEDTILHAKLKLDIVEAIVDSVDNANRELYVKIMNSSGQYNGSKMYKLPEGTTVTGIESAYVTLWVNDKTNTAINVSKSEDSEIVFDYISKINDKDEKSNFTDLAKAAVKSFTLKNANVKYDVADNFSVTLNQADYTGNYGKAQLGTFVKLIIKDSRIERMEMTSAEKSGIIKSVQKDYIDYQVTDKTTSRVRGFESAVRNLTVIIDGQLKSYADLKADMYFMTRAYTVPNDSTKKDYVIIATSKRVEGNLTKVKSDEIGIGSETLKRPATMYLSTDNGQKYTQVTDESVFNKLFGTKVQAVVNGYGQVVYLQAAPITENEFYGIVTGAWSNDKDMVRIDKIVNGVVERVSLSVDSESTAEFAKIDTAYKAHSSTSVADRLANLYKFTLDSDGEIDTAAAVSLTNEITAKSFDELDGRIIGVGVGNNYDVSSAVMFDVTDPDGIKAIDWAKAKNTDDNVVDGILFRSNAIDSEVVVFTGGTDSLGGSDKVLGFVNTIVTVSTDDNSMDIDAGAQDISVLVDKKYTASEDQIAVYQTLSDGRAKVFESAAYNNLTALADQFKPYLDTITAGTGATADTVTKVQNNWITFQTGVTVGGVTANQFKAATDAVVYEITDYGTAQQEFVKSDAASIDEGNQVFYFIHKDQIKAMFFVR